MDAAETGRRVRAARAYAGLAATELSQRVGVSRSTLLRIEYGQRTAKRGELLAVAEVTGVAPAFFDDDSPCFD